MLELASLYVKPKARAPMQRLREIAGLAGHGLVGDASADAGSPRHVLLVSEDDVRALALDPHDLRANLVVRGNVDGLASGQLLAFGTLVLRITIPCEPCGRLNQVRAGLSKEIGIRRGVLARVLSSGRAEVGDSAAVLPRTSTRLHPDWRDRVDEIVRRVPPDHVVSHAALARAAGVQPAYCRALPTVLRSLASRGAPVHRVMPASALRPSSRVWDAASYFTHDEAP
ncbi:MAG TPA: MOSC domain-containing protein [Kofleriaceae bacterium]|nr:MOSC domain-containing protein [Kofleriaceae bacterium]